MITCFTFVVITYNHSEYLLEHLESIKHLIIQYAGDIDVSIIVSDDASTDDTVLLARHWLDSNKLQFSGVEIITREENVGVCKSVMESFDLVKTEYFKLTAGDDVYSCENLFKDFSMVNNHEIVSGVPLNLVDGVLDKSHFNVFNLFATREIYAGKDYIEKLKGISFSYAPAMTYSHAAVSNNEVKNFLKKFSVIEDFPLHIRMAEIFSPLRFFQSKLVHIYYRRTAGSIYIVRRTRYDLDKLSAFEYLKSNEKNRWKRHLLGNRIFCYRSESRFIKIVFNLNYYLYVFRVLMKLWKIVPEYCKFDSDVERHQGHYDMINAKARKARNAFPGGAEVAAAEAKIEV
jgi:glycosyltransferase involved in cell wall biosynthesis